MLILSPQQTKDVFQKINERPDYAKETQVDDENMADELEDDTLDNIFSQLNNSDKIKALEAVDVSREFMEKINNN